MHRLLSYRCHAWIIFFSGLVIHHQKDTLVKYCLSRFVLSCWFIHAPYSKCEYMDRDRKSCLSGKRYWYVYTDKEERDLMK